MSGTVSTTRASAPGLAVNALMALLLSLAAWALVAVFVGVARQAVRQGVERQHANALQHEAAWRCRALSSLAARDRCQALWRERAPTDSLALQALVLEAAAAP